jgi:NAD(P)-dependent dehydrogenase (short-subunit alcohol dehydrogenase family)
MRLDGKVAIVTGAAGGVGEATALRLAEEGAAVVCADLQAAAVEALAGRVEQAGGRALGIAADVSTPAGNAAAVATAVERFGGLDVLHANAAVQVMGKLGEMPADGWDRLYRTNLRGVGLGAEAAIPAMRARGGGAIVMTASLLGIVGDPDMPAYGAMKGGLRALCRSLAAGHGADGIRVNTICPGDVETPMLQDFFDHQPDPAGARAALVERYPLGRFATPRDVANVVAFLASDEAVYLTGIDVVVDGGLLARIY